MKPKPLHIFSKERLEADRKLPKHEIVQFLEDIQLLTSGNEGPTQAISLRVPENLLRVFKAFAAQDGLKYQTQIVRLMRDWVAGRRG